MKVNGICPPSVLVNDTKRISINTIPDAPNSPVLKNETLSKPVINAVITIMNKVNLDPYFSSIIGPNKSMKVILPSKCSILPCPITCENRLKIDAGLVTSTVVPTVKKFISIPAINLSAKNTPVQINANVRMTGELYFMLIINC